MCLDDSIHAVTREGGVSAPDWRREDATPQEGAEHERVSEGEWESDRRREAETGE